MTRKTLNAIAAILILTVVSYIIVAAAFGVAAFAHEGNGTWHPIDCEDVVVPPGATCYAPSTYDGQQDVDADHGQSFHLFHPVCEVVGEGQGSAAGRPVWVTCLPETGTDIPIAALTAALALVAGAGIVAFSGGTGMTFAAGFALGALVTFWCIVTGLFVMGLFKFLIKDRHTPTAAPTWESKHVRIVNTNEDTTEDYR